MRIKENLTAVRIGKTHKYQVYVNGHYIAVVAKVGKQWETGDSKNGFSTMLTFDSLKQAAEYHETNYSLNELAELIEIKLQEAITDEGKRIYGILKKDVMTFETIAEVVDHWQGEYNADRSRGFYEWKTYYEAVINIASDMET